MATELIAIGASAGGLAVIESITRNLPATYPIPIVVVLHLKQGLTSDYLDYFRNLELKTSEAIEKHKPLPGHFYVAPPGYHLLTERDGTFSLSVDDPVKWARPSIDVFFESAAEAYGNRLVGIILSGASDDGAAGLAAVKAHGGTCIVQNPFDAEAPTMPAATIKRTPVDHVMNAEGIAAILRNLGSSTPATGVPTHA